MLAKKVNIGWGPTPLVVLQQFLIKPLRADVSLSLFAIPHIQSDIVDWSLTIQILALSSTWLSQPLCSRFGSHYGGPCVVNI